jgi:hypothetical protein
MEIESFVKKRRELIDMERCERGVPEENPMVPSSALSSALLVGGRKKLPRKVEQWIIEYTKIFMAIVASNCQYMNVYWWRIFAGAGVRDVGLIGAGTAWWFE